MIQEIINGEVAEYNPFRQQVAEMDNMPLLGECQVWQTQIENAMAAHANVSELETASMGA